MTRSRFLFMLESPNTSFTRWTRSKKSSVNFPVGTKFILSISPIESAANDQAIAELRTFSQQPWNGVDRRKARQLKWLLSVNIEFDLIAASYHGMLPGLASSR